MLYLPSGRDGCAVVELDGSVSNEVEGPAFREVGARAEVAARLRSKPSSKLICAQVGLRSRLDCVSTPSEEDAMAVEFVPCMVRRAVRCSVIALVADAL